MYMYIFYLIYIQIIYKYNLIFSIRILIIVYLYSITISKNTCLSLSLSTLTVVLSLIFYLYLITLIMISKISPIHQRGLVQLARLECFAQKGLGLSSAISSLHWRATYKSNVSPLWGLQLSLALVWESPPHLNFISPYIYIYISPIHPKTYPAPAPRGYSHPEEEMGWRRGTYDLALSHLISIQIEKCPHKKKLKKKKKFLLYLS